MTRELAQRSGLTKEMRILDLGCGIGGPARLLAEAYGCHVTGVDVTEEYVSTATRLSELTQLAGRTEFIQADALDLPFNAGVFDVAWTQHVQMNIGDKHKFYSEIKRVLKPGGRFVYYDVFYKSVQPIDFPVPWADSELISHLVTTERLHEILGKLGFRPIEILDQSVPGIRYLQKIIDRFQSRSRPGLLMGENWQEKLVNLHENLARGRLVLESGAWINH